MIRRNNKNYKKTELLKKIEEFLRFVAKINWNFQIV